MIFIAPPPGNLIRPRSGLLFDLRGDPWRTQSAVTDVGRSAHAIDKLSGSVSSLREVSQKLVAHYQGSDDGKIPPVTGERLKDVDTRFADAMFLRLLERRPSLSGERLSEQRLAGCCRDYAVLFVSMARHKGIPARVRVGFASYFKPYYVDHVIAEVWDGDAGRWRMVEPEISDEFAIHAGIDPLDVSSEKFVNGSRAWKSARSGAISPERFVGVPKLKEYRGWPSLRYHLVQDLAALNKAEMLIWDQWGILNEKDPLARADVLDRLAEETSRPDCAASSISEWGKKDGLRVPREVTSYSPASPSPLTVDVGRVLQGTLKSS